MYFRIDDAYRLVGWKELPAGILNLVKNEVSFLPRDEYGLLLHMNGQEEINTGELTEKQQNTIRRFLECGLIRKGAEPFAPSTEKIYHYYDHACMDRVQWSITGKCNYNCRHCFISAPRNDTEDLNTEKCLDIIRQIAECGIRKVAFTGGEPLIRKDLPELIKACSNAGIQITELYTNGALLTRKLLDQFISEGHHPIIWISYDGIGWHDWVRGCDGAQRIAEDALCAAHRAGLKTGASMSLFRDNIPAIRNTVLRLAALSVETIKISPMMSLGLWGENYTEKTLSNEAFLNAVLDYIPFFFEDGKPCNLKMGGFFDYFRDRDLCTSSAVKDPDVPAPLYPCMSMAYTMYIGSDGKVLPCMGFAGQNGYDSFPNLQHMPLAQILRESVLLKTARTKLTDVYAQNKDCVECPERGKHCGQSCRACAEPGLCGIDPQVCFLVKTGRFRQIQEAVTKAGGRYVLL